MAFKGDGSRNRGSGRADTNPKEARERSGGGGADRGGGVSPDKLKQAYKDYATSMQQKGMANLAGPPGYNSAVAGFDDRSFGWDVLDFLAGPLINVKRPSTTIPGSYSGGTWHTSTSIPGTLGALAGAAAGIWGGGLIGSTIGDAAGIPDLYHGSYDDGSALHSPQPNGYNGNRGYGGSGGYSGNGYDRDRDPTQSGLLGLGTAPKPAQTTQGLLGVAAKTPEVLQDKTRRQWGFGTQSIPGPSPYSFTTARWL